MNKVLCFLFGHRYFIIKEFSYAVRKVGCFRCGRKWGMNDRVKVFIKWDRELEEFHYKGLLK